MMKSITQKELDQIIEEHEKWLVDKSTGKRADLSFTNLRGIKLQYKNLSEANLEGADLSHADLQCISLSRANLTKADLYKTNLTHAYLYNVNLCGAHLYETIFKQADLQDAYLQFTNLHKANLQQASLYNANLYCAHLCHANLSYADIRNSKMTCTRLFGTNLHGVKGLDRFNICPAGCIIGYKKTTENNILKLEIPRRAKRCNKIGSRKCRASKVKILGMYNEQGKYSTQFSTQRSMYDSTLFSPGQIIEVPNFCDDIRQECAPGIHFFLTYNEAKEYVA